MWYDRVYTTSLGVTTARNALASYALFQDWGNDPLKYEKRDDYKKLLATIAQLFPTGQTGPSPDAANDLDTCSASASRGITDPVTGSVAARNPIIKWHFSVPGPEASRRRDRQSHAPQLPVAHRPARQRRGQSRSGREHGADGADSRRPVHGRQGGAARDRAAAGDRSAAARRVGRARRISRLRHRSTTKKLDPNLKFGSRGMSGTNPDAIEAWAFDPFTLEALLQAPEALRQRRAALRRRALQRQHRDELLHEGQRRSRALRAVHQQRLQERDAVVHHDDRSQPRARAHDRARQPLGAERMGWLRKPSNPIVLRRGQEREGHPARVCARSSSSEPTLLPTLGWPEDTTINPAQLPDWSWRVGADLRPAADAERPARDSGRSSSPIRLDVEAALTEARRTARDRRLPGGRRAPSARARDAEQLAADPVPQQLRRSCASSGATACCTRSTRCTPPRGVRKRRARAAEAGSVRAARGGARRRPGASRPEDDAASSTRQPGAAHEREVAAAGPARRARGSARSCARDARRRRSSRNAIVRDLGGDAVGGSAAPQFPPAGLHSVKAYRDASEPGLEALLAALQDFRAFHEALRAFGESLESRRRCGDRREGYRLSGRARLEPHPPALSEPVLLHAGGQLRRRHRLAVPGGEFDGLQYDRSRCARCDRLLQFDLRSRAATRSAAHFDRRRVGAAHLRRIVLAGSRLKLCGPEVHGSRTRSEVRRRHLRLGSGSRRARQRPADALDRRSHACSRSSSSARISGSIRRDNRLTDNLAHDARVRAADAGRSGPVPVARRRLRADREASVAITGTSMRSCSARAR